MPRKLKSLLAPSQAPRSIRKAPRPSRASKAARSPHAPARASSPTAAAALTALADKLGLSIPELIQAARNDKIQLVSRKPPTTPTNNGNGDNNGNKDEPRRPRREDFAALAGKEHAITIREAAELTEAEGWELPKILASTIRSWYRKGYIKRLEKSEGGRGKWAKFDRADVAFCKALYQYRIERNGASAGYPLFDEDKNPVFDLRFEWVSEYRRRKKQTKGSSSTANKKQRA